MGYGRYFQSHTKIRPFMALPIEYYRHTKQKYDNKMEKIQICVKMCCDLAKSKPLNCLCLSFPSYCLIFVMSEVTFLQEMRAIKGIDYSFLSVKKMQ